MTETIFILKKDLPTIKAGRVIKLSKDGKMGFPILMSVEEQHVVSYGFPIDVLKEEKEWFGEATRNNEIAPAPIENDVSDVNVDYTGVVIADKLQPEVEEFKRGDKVNFKGNNYYAPMKGTYVWAVSDHMMLMYYIEHPDGNKTKEIIARNGGLPDGFETPHSKNFKEGLKYICVIPEELEKAETDPHNRNTTAINT